MPVIDIGMTRPFFLGLMRIQLTRLPPVPVPELLPLHAAGRLIAGMSWGDAPAIEPTLPTDMPGTLKLRIGASIQHISIAELDADADSQGQTWSGDLIVRVRPEPGQLHFEIVAAQPQGAQIDNLHPPRRIGGFDLPEFALVAAIPPQFVRQDESVYLRFISIAGSPQDFSSPLPGVTGQWSINIPRECFTQLVRGFLTRAAKPEKGMAIEEAAFSNWVHDGGQWGVNAGVGIVKRDACPAFFEDVDISVDLAVRLRLFPIPVDDPTQLRIDVRLEANGSDWDAFRCWLGSAGLAGIKDIFDDPEDKDGWHELFYIPRTIGGLMYVGRQISGELSREIQDQTIGQGFAKTGGQEQWAEFSSTVDIPTLVGEMALEISDTGILITGASPIAGSARHEVGFTPPVPGPLGGEWSWKVNCSHRSMDLKYTVQGVVITDKVILPNGDSDDSRVIVFPTSTALPAGWTVNLPFTGATTQVVTAHSSTATPGSTARLFVHSSAGLRRFDILPLRNWVHLVTRGGIRRIEVAVEERRAFGMSLEEQQQLLETYCDSITLPSRIIERTELKWVEPPPDWNYGFPALKQWQVVVRNLAPGQPLRIVDAALGGEAILASAIANTRGAALLEFVTHEGIRPMMTAEQTPAGAEMRMLQRWLLPVEARPAQTIERTRSPSLVAGQFRDVDGTVRLMIAPRTHHKGPVQSLSGGRVRVNVGDKSFIAVVREHVGFR